MKKPKKEQIEDLKKILLLIEKAYFLQNKADLILFENFDIDKNLFETFYIDKKHEFKENDFFNMTKINTSTNLYLKQIAVLNLLKKLEL